MKNNKNNIYEDSLSIYMKEASETPLLERQAEADLVKLVRKWLDHPKARKPTVKKGEEARNKLIKSNLRLVIKIAKEYRNLGLDFGDLISEGNIGLTQGIEKFRSDRGAKLSYYVAFWIKQYIRRAISNKGRTIRLPVAIVDLKMKITKFVDKFYNEKQRYPTDLEVATGLEIPLKKVKKMTRVNFQSKSLNQTLDSENELEIGGFIEDKGAENPYQELLTKDEKLTLSKLIKGLDLRQQYIIKHRFGIGDVETQTLESIGKKFDLTRERIRQLEEIALDNLRDMCRKIKWTSYKK